MKEKRLNEAKGIALLAVGLMVVLSLIRFEPLDLGLFTSHPNAIPQNLLGIFGAYVGGFFVFLFGRITSFAIPLLIFLFGIRFFRQQPPYMSVFRFIGICILMVSISSLLGLVGFKDEFGRFSSAGFLGSLSSEFISSYFGRMGALIIFVTFFILSLALVTEILISSLFLNLFEKIKTAFSLLRISRPQSLSIKPRLRPRRQLGLVPASSAAPSEKVRPQQPDNGLKIKTYEPKIQIKAKTQAPAVPIREKKQEMKEGEYVFPSLDLLTLPSPVEAKQMKEDLSNNASVLEATLEDFGISVKVTDIERGPVITRYELEPAPGVKLNRIVALGDDIGLAMKAQSIRIVAPIPGKGKVGVEVPNIQSSLVYLREVLSSSEFQKAESILSLALGKDIAGHAVVTDLSEMPHLLIAGTTGSGKTVCVNSLILSLLYRASPQELKFLMVDPKMVELAPFNGLPHLICPVVTDAKKASAALNWVVSEMEERYQLLAKAGARNIVSYNQKQEKIPYIIVIIDELADLMIVSRDQIENAITRLAQLSRAVGIHLILATQRPSVDVITGVIKANFPARISFKVASKVDSRTVLDANGADKLLGRGDMLFLKPGEAKLIRAQGTLVSDKEIENVVSFIKSQAEPVYDEEILSEQKKALSGSGGGRDDMYNEAVRVVMETNQASVSILQRRLRLGHTRAARIIDMMEQEGLVGEFEGSKPRKILINRQEWLDNFYAEKNEESQTQTV